MNILTFFIAVGALMLISALPAAGQSTPAPHAGSPVAAEAESPPGRETYAQRAGAEIREWQQKLRDLGTKAEANGKVAGSAAESEWNKAWTKAQAASGKLQTLGAEGWEDAKVAFEEASRDLAAAWREIRPEEK